MIRSRWRNVDMNVDDVVARLQVVHLTVRHEIGAEALESLRLLRDDGLTLSIRLLDWSEGWDGRQLL